MLPATQFTHHWAENTSTNGLVVLSHQNSGIAVEANNRTIGTPHVLGGADDNGAVHIAIFHAATRRSFLRSEEHTPELQSLMRISYAVFCLNKKKAHQYYAGERVFK